MKKLICVILCIAALLALFVPAGAAHVSAEEAIAALETLGLVKGTGSGFEPERSATRAEAAVMLLRLLGQEQAAAAAGEPCPFTDAGWAAPYLGYAARAGLVRGRSGTFFDASAPVSIRDYLTMVLRALGYSETAGDFTWDQSIAFADSIGLTHGEYTAASECIREDMALISYTALTLRLKDGKETLIRKLYLDGAVSADALKATRLVSAVAAGRPVYSAEELYEMSSSAVFYIKMYEDSAKLAADDAFATGSGFFVTGDGVALLCYHELDGAAFARVMTSDGHSYDVTGVLYYDPMRDVAVIRVSRTDTEGNTVRFFPYLDLGDSDTAYQGQPVYTIGAPLGQRDCISDGMVANRLQAVDDPAYPCILFTAPISSGSSGGPLLNAQGEALGIAFASFREGQDLNLGVPVNSVAAIPFTGAGIPLEQVKTAETEKWDAAVLTLEREEVTIGCGQTTEILVSHDGPGTAAFSFQIDTSGVAELRWGSFITKRSIPLVITGLNPGETDVKVRLVYGPDERVQTVMLHILVVGDAAAGGDADGMQEETP